MKDRYLYVWSNTYGIAAYVCPDLECHWTKALEVPCLGSRLTGNADNSILRGYNSIYHQASQVLDEDKADFVGYCLAWFKFVKSHHDDEEATLFTKIEELLKDKEIFGDTHKEHGKFRGHVGADSCADH